MIEVAREGALHVLTLNRPDKANALTAAMLNELADAVLAASDDADARALILTGTGKVFSAGADLDEVRGGTLATDPAWERLSGAIAASPLVTIAALNGTAAGGALGMVLAADLRVAVPGALIFYPVIKMGVLPQPSDPGRLAALAGPSRAAHLLLTGARIDAETALTWGLLDRISDDPITEARELAAPALAASRDQITGIKALIARG